MSVLNVALWVGGVALIVLAVMQMRGPLARMSELDRLAENARRYDNWRGGRRGAGAEEGPTGADVMRAMLRRRVLIWATVAALGVASVVAGFALQ